MHAENFLVDQSGDWEAVEYIREDLPESDGVPTFALIVEPIDSVNLGALVVSSEQEEVLRVLHLVAEKEADALNRLLSTVNVISKEEVVGFRWETAILENPQKVVILSMDIAYKIN